MEKKKKYGVYDPKTKMWALSFIHVGGDCRGEFTNKPTEWNTDNGSYPPETIIEIYGGGKYIVKEIK